LPLIQSRSFHLLGAAAHLRRQHSPATLATRHPPPPRAPISADSFTLLEFSETSRSQYPARTATYLVHPKPAGRFPPSLAGPRSSGTTGVASTSPSPHSGSPSASSPLVTLGRQHNHRTGRPHVVRQLS
jgi:hypothetical protein